MGNTYFCEGQVAMRVCMNVWLPVLLEFVVCLYGGCTIYIRWKGVGGIYSVGDVYNSNKTGLSQISYDVMYTRQESCCIYVLKDNTFPAESCTSILCKSNKIQLR